MSLGTAAAVPLSVWAKGRLDDCVDAKEGVEEVDDGDVVGRYLMCSLRAW